MHVYRNPAEHREAVLKSKERLRRELAQLPFEEKVRRLRRLQELAKSLRPVREQLRELFQKRQSTQRNQT